jgi:hypothetical protein
VQSLHTYLSSFDKRIRGYTGTPAEFAQIAKEVASITKKFPAKTAAIPWIIPPSSI